MAWADLRVRHGRIHCLVLLILSLHGGLLVYSAFQHSPVTMEVNQLTAGLSHLYLKRFDLFRVNPPLVRTLAVLPVAVLAPKTDWHSYNSSPLARPDVDVGQDFLKANGPRSLWFFTLARWVCLPFGVLGGYVCFRFARDLFGISAGLLAMTLWCFCPYILGHGSLITADAPAAAMGITAYYLFWRWLNQTHWRNTIVVGVVLGLAALTKLTLLILYPLLLPAWLVHRLSGGGPRSARAWSRDLGMLLAAIVLSVLAINLGYAFERSLRPLEEYQFRSRLLGGRESAGHGPLQTGNRFAGTWLGPLPVPLPANYLQGIDAQRWDFERKGWSYLGGQWQEGGWWYYYLFALAIKLPSGTLMLLALGVLASFCSAYRAAWLDEILLLLPLAAILALVSSQWGFSTHSRYVIPVLPFVYVWCSRVARAMEAGHRVPGGAAVLAVCLSVGSSLWCYPHSVAYFNELAGGPAQGHAYLLDSNVAWGQDLYYLKRWYLRHPEARPLHVAHYGYAGLRLAGIESSLPSIGPTERLARPPASLDDMGPYPGWYAIDANHLHGARCVAVDGQDELRHLVRDQCDVTYFQHLVPVAMAGYSLHIYHVTLDEANRVRRRLGLPELPMDGRRAKLERVPPGLPPGRAERQ